MLDARAACTMAELNFISFLFSTILTLRSLVNRLGEWRLLMSFHTIGFSDKELIDKILVQLSVWDTDI